MIEEYLYQIQLDPSEYITFEVYCAALDSDIYLQERFSDLRIVRALKKVFNDLKRELKNIARQFKLSYQDLIKAFKNRDVFGVLKAFGFKIKLAFKAINELTKFVRGGLFEVFREIARTRTFQKIRSGAVKVDEVLNAYPVLKKMTGIAIAGLLLWIWLNMTFIGDLDYDFNFGDMADALAGKFSIAELFTSAQGLMLMTLFGTGFAFGLSVPWLGKSLYNFILALVYTAYAKLKDPESKVKLRDFKRRLKGEKLVR